MGQCAPQGTLQKAPSPRAIPGLGAPHPPVPPPDLTPQLGIVSLGVGPPLLYKPGPRCPGHPGGLTPTSPAMTGEVTAEAPADGPEEKASELAKGPPEPSEEVAASGRPGEERAAVASPQAPVPTATKPAPPSEGDKRWGRWEREAAGALGILHPLPRPQTCPVPRCC